MKLLLFAASLRKESINKKVIKIINKKLIEKGVICEEVAFESLRIPLYSQDIQDNEGFPQDLTDFAEKLKEANGWIISSPEYNFSIPGTLKNLIDWLSRMSPQPIQNKPILLCSASPSAVGGNRGLWATRVPLEVLKGFVFPDMFSLAGAYEAIDEKTFQLKDQKLDERLDNLLVSFQSFCKKLS